MGELIVVFWHGCDQILLEAALKQKGKRKLIAHARQNQIPPQDGIFVLILSLLWTK
jgi:hypothetical protein